VETVKDVLSRKETADFLGICLTTLDRLGIPRIKIRHKVLYKRDVVMKWLDANTEKSVKKVGDIK